MLKNDLEGCTADESCAQELEVKVNKVAKRIVFVTPVRRKLIIILFRIFLILSQYNENIIFLLF